MSEEQRILVMGIGNVLMLDEGVGCRVIEELIARYEFPDNVTVQDSGTMGMMILNLFKEHDYIIVIDAVDGTGHEPGTVLRFSPEDIAPNTVRHSLHDTRFIDVLEAAEMIDCRPGGECVGIQIEEMNPADLTIGLTPAVEAAIEGAVDAVLTILGEMGVSPVPRQG